MHYLLCGGKYINISYPVTGANEASKASFNPSAILSSIVTSVPSVLSVFHVSESVIPGKKLMNDNTEYYPLF